ncbi:MAG: branched-chain amino acid ABC transporter permease [Deltaproteobacteria bacterium]|nr:MAG: branched-chain amino acid ABC transporter permease [Deltaproteobacteria bacterium]
MKRSTIAGYWGIGLVLLVFPLVIKNPYWVDVLNNVGLYAILGLSLNLILGHAGLFHMGHAAFYAVGAYTTAIISTTWHIPVLWLFPLSGLTAGIFALIVARPIIHLRGDYLLIVTIGMVEIVRIALINDIFGITGGSNGIFGISRPMIFGYKIAKPHQFYYLIGSFLVVSIFLFRRLEASRFGRALNYIKADDVAAEGCGVNTAYYKLAAFVIGAVWAGMAGNIFAAKMTIIAPESFNFWESVILFTMVILGGSGSIPGVLLGAVIVIGLPELFREFASARMLVFGAAMVAMMIFRNKGILPPVPRTYRYDRHRTTAANQPGGGA